MNRIKKSLDIGTNIGTGLGLTLVGIFILNIHYFFNTPPYLLQKIFGLGFCIFGISGMLISLGVKNELKFFEDIGAALIVFIPSFILFVFTTLLWLKVIFAVLVCFSLLFVGIAIGRSLLREDGSLRINLKSLPRFFIILLTTLASVLSALGTLTEKGEIILEFIRKIF